MRILILNPNTSESMTAEIAAAAKPRFGAAAIDSAAESYRSAVGVMDVVATMVAAGDFDVDAVILAGFGEHGKDALQEMLSLARSIPAIEDRLTLAGLTTSRVGALAEGPANPRTYWTISTTLGLTP
jgi:allantoin racemase